MVRGRGHETRVQEGQGPDTPFAEALEELRQDGSAFLITGGVRDEVHASACGQFLGTDSPHARGQVVVTSSGDHLEPGPSTGPGDRRRVLELASEYRAAATAEHASSPTPVVPEDRITLHGLGELGRATVDAITAVEPPGGFDPADLRLCFDAFDVGLEDFGESALFEFLHLLTAQVRSRDGILHVHFRGNHEASACRTVAPLFDGLVELRTAPNGAEQRWHLREPDITSDWLPVSE